MIVSFDNAYSLPDNDSEEAKTIPEVHEIVTNEIQLDEKKVRLSVWDTAGGDSYSRLRPMAYPESNVFLACFSIGDPKTLDDIRNTWVPEIKSRVADKPIVLVGTKQDLRESVS